MTAAAEPVAGVRLLHQYRPLFRREPVLPGGGDNRWRYAFITGGRGSGKSFHVALFLLNLTYEPGHVILFTRHTLAAADVSMAMGRGSAIAHAAGDLLLMRDSLAALPEAVRVARAALLRVRQNLRWAAGYNLAAIPLAALGFMPPWLAALGMSLSSLVVVFNARRPLTGADGQESRP